MRKTYSLFSLLALSAALSTSISLKAQTFTPVFTDNYNRPSFTTGSTGGVPATLYKFTTGGAFTISTTLVSGGNYRVDMVSPAAAQKALYYAPMAPFSAPFSRQLNLNVGLLTWTFNMRTSVAATSTAVGTGISGGIDLCGNKAGNILSGQPTGYGVVFNSSATGGVDLVKFSAGLATNTILVTQTTTMPKTDYYSVRVTYDPATNHWSLFVRDDGAGGFGDPSSGVTLQQGSTITDNTYAGIVMVNFGAVYTTTAGAGKTMSVDNFQVAVTVPPCTAPGVPTGLSYTNTATSSSVSFTPPGTAPSGYILVESNGPLVGNPTTGQAVTVGTAVGSNGTIVGFGTASPVTTTSALTGNTGYTMTLFPYNNTGCTGGPLFNTAVSSTNITTCPNAPTLTGAGAPTANTIPGVTWSAPAAGGGVYATYTYLLNVYTDAGLTLPALGYPLAGTTVTSPYTITGLTSGVTYWYTVTAVDPACNSAPSASNNATTSIVPCSGTPTAGVSTSTSRMVTGAAAFTLGLAGASGETGINFQWQSSPCGDTWTNISGVTSSYSFPATETSSLFYRCNVTCTNSGITAPSAPIFVGRVATAYCNPTSASGCSAGDGVNAFTLAGSCGTSLSDPGPLLCGATNVDHTSYAPVELYAGSSYAATVNCNSDGDDVYVWIDFNNSGTFDASELVYSTNTAIVPGTPFFYSFSIPIPAIAVGATPGIHRMRVVVDNAQVLVTGCDALSFGTSVDYTVQILPNVVLTANAPLCLPGALVLTATPAIACGAVYNWSGPLGYTNATTDINTVSPPANAGVYSVSVSANGVNSCPSPATLSVTVYSSPVITGIMGMCIGSTTTLAGAPTGGTWASSSSAVSTIGSSTGFATGVSLGAAIMSYTIPSTGCYATSAMAITTTPVVYAVTGGGNFCAGGVGVHVGLSNSGSGVSYQLYNGAFPVGVPKAGSGSSIDFGLVTAAGAYTVVANPGSSCATNMSGSAVVVINSLPTVYSLTGGGNYCPGGTGIAVGLSNSDLTVNYQLYCNGAPIGSSMPGTGLPLNFGLQTAVGNYDVVATNASACKDYMTSSVTVSLYPLPTLFSVTGGGGYCAGGMGADIGLNGSAIGVSYRLYNGIIPIGLAIPGTGAALDFGLQTSAGVYTITATDGTTACNDNMLGSATVTINPPPAVSNVTGGGAYCSGGTGVHIGLNGSVLGTNYFLYDGSTLLGGASGTSAPLDFGLELLAGVYTVSATVTSTGCSGNMAGSATITVNSLPILYTVTGGGSYCAGGAGVSVGLSGSSGGTNYQVLNNGVPVGAVVPGTGGVLSLGTFTATGIYTVVATTTSTGCVNTMTGSVTITVNPLPTAYPVTGGGGYCTGGTGVDIALGSSDIGINYQLYNLLTPMGTAVAGTGGLLDFGLQNAAGNYTVTATNVATGCSNTMSGSPAVIINPLPVPYLFASGDSYCSGGVGVDLDLDNSSPGTNYQLYLGSMPIGSPLPGITGTALNFGLQTVAGTYTVIATNTSTGCTNTMSGAAVITISPLPTTYTVTGGGNYCAGGTGLHVSLSSSDAGINYQLYNGVSMIGSAMPGTGVALDFGAMTSAGAYTVIATNTVTGCTNTMSGSVNITINALPMAFNVTGGGGYCASGTGVHIGLVASAAGVSYQLYNGVSAMGSAITGTGSPLDFGLQTIAGTYTVVGTDMSTSCTNTMTGSVTVTVNASPALHNVTGGGNYCVGGTGVHIGLNGTDGGVNYQLYNGATAVGSPVSGSGPAIDFGLQMAAGTYTVMATNLATGCVRNMSGSAAVSVSATPTIYSITGGGNYCPSGSGIAVGLSGSDPSISYQLYNGISLVGGAVTGTGSAITFGLQTLAGNYTVVANGSIISCTANMSGTAIVGVSTPPTAYTVGGGGGYCSGGAGVTVSLSASDAGTNYQLYNGITAVGSPMAGSGTALSFGPETAAGLYTVVATDGTTTCSNTMTGSAPVIVNPLPTTYTVSGGGGYCAGGAGVSVLLSGSDIGTNYQLNNGIPTGSVIPGTGAALDFGPQTAVGTYTVSTIIVSTGCTGNMPGSAVVAINALPTAYNVTGGGNYCAGGTGVHVQLGGSATGISYQLYNGVSPAGASMAGNGSMLDFGLQTAGGTYTVSATNTVTGCVNTMTGSATVVANPLPTVYAVTGGGPYCAGGTGSVISLAGTDGGVNYQLYRGTAAVGGALPGTGGTLSFGAQGTPGGYLVTATNPVTGCAMNMSGFATVSVNALPVTYTVTGGGAYCSGGTGVHVGLSGSTSGIIYQLYDGVTTAGLPSTGAGTILDFGLQTTAGNYTVVATNGSTGCTSTMTGSAPVGINTLPVAYAVTGGGSYCAGGTGVNIGLGGSSTGIHYQLQLSSAMVGSVVSGTGGALSFGLRTVGGTYTVVATNAATGCSSTMADSAIISVNPAPTAYGVIGGGSYCAGGTGVHVGIGNTTIGVSYKLYNGTTTVDDPLSGTGSAIDFGSEITPGTYTIVGTDIITGCVGNMSGSVAISVNALPTAYAITGGGSYCAGGTGVHVGLSSSATGINYTLYSGTSIGTTHGAGGSLDFGLQTGAGNYIATAVNAATGCSDTMSGSAAIVINPAVVPSVTISSPGGNQGCSGRISNFTAVPLNGGSIPVYHWTINGIPAGAGSTYSYIPLNGDIVGLTLNSNAMCATPSTATNSVVMTVGTTELPTVVVASDHGSEVCQGTAVTFTAIPSFGGSAPSYTWMKNGVTVSIGASNTYSLAPLNSDVIYCVLSSNYNCRLLDTGLSNSINMTVDAPVIPTVVITATNGGSVAAGVQEVLTATVTNGGPSPTYQWYVDNIAVPGATLPIFASKVFSDQDNITCKVMSDAPCPVQGSATITVSVWNVGVKQVKSLDGVINVLPNPNKGTFNIVGSIGTTTDEELSIELTDLLGHVVYNDKVIVKNGKVNERVQLSNSLSNGMYLLHLYTETQHNVFHIVVEQ